MTLWVIIAVLAETNALAAGSDASAGSSLETLRSLAKVSNVKERPPVDQVSKALANVESSFKSTKDSIDFATALCNRDWRACFSRTVGC